MEIIDYGSDEIEDTFSILITSEHHKQFKRLDQLLASLTDLSRSVVKNLFEKGLVFCEQSKIELKKLPQVGSTIIVQIPPAAPSSAQPENIPLEILFEDEYLAIINKPAGMVTHPAPGNYTGTLVNAVLHHCPNLRGVGEEKRPGIVHRLDKGTSGVMVVAKEQKCHEGLVQLFSRHDIIRKYQCLVVGNKVDPSGKLEGNIGRHPQNRLKMAITEKGKHAVTYYRVINYFDRFSHLEMTLETGRTHQIRVHLSSILKRPILCDPLYANPLDQLKNLGPQIQKILKDYPYPLLHAKVLGFVHPITKKELYFETELPGIFQSVLDCI
ncbi:MAG: RluA family pseudouridine synthase [Halobacteriovoraceae bacterium]|nr:RluA family pseudouridine synthase [Halobacteriovoraceae bacterium]